MFLLLVKHKFVVVPQADEIIEDLLADPPVFARAAVVEVSETRIEDHRLEDNGSRLADRLAENPLNTAYDIFIDSSLEPSLVPVTIKTGTRVQRIKEVVEIESGGKVVGTTIQDV